MNDSQRAPSADFLWAIIFTSRRAILPSDLPIPPATRPLVAGSTLPSPQMYAFNGPRRVMRRSPRTIVADWRAFGSGPALIRRGAVGGLSFFVLRGIARPGIEAFPKLGDCRLVQTVASEVI